MQPRRRVVGGGGRAASAAVAGTRRHKPDYQIVLYMVLLMLLGLVVIYAIGPQRANVLNNAYGTDFYGSTYFFLKQMLSLGAAVAAFVVASMIPYAFLQKHARKILGAGFVACLLLLLFGNLMHVDSIVQCSLGACRWLNIGPLSLQPAEIVKFGILIFAAGFLGARAQAGLINDTAKTLIPLGIVVGAAIFFVIVLQKDMGTGISLIAILAAMLFIAGLRLRTWLLLAVGMVLLTMVFIVTAPHRIARVAAFFSGDSATVQDAGAYHIAHAKIAIGSGGLSGVGIGNSVQATGYLPEAINDSVFAVMGETFGFVGLVAILALFTALLFRLLKVADHLTDVRQRLFVVGAFGWLGSHVMLNVGAMTGVIPLTGITLPLLSFGGTSMVFIAAILGISFQLSRYAAPSSRTQQTQQVQSWKNRGVASRRAKK